MKQEIRDQWADALEAGYDQGFGILCKVRPNGNVEWCCLGVLCDLALKAGVISEQDIVLEEYDPDGTKNRSYAGESCYVPEVVMEWAGLTHRNPNVPGLDKPIALVNDEGYSFEFIANEIREHGDLL